jgi:hypothetical protein
VQSDLRIVNKAVSRNHAEILVQGGVVNPCLHPSTGRGMVRVPALLAGLPALRTLRSVHGDVCDVLHYTAVGSGSNWFDRGFSERGLDYGVKQL